MSVRVMPRPVAPLDASFATVAQSAGAMVSVAASEDARAVVTHIVPSPSGMSCDHPPRLPESVEVAKVYVVFEVGAVGAGASSGVMASPSTVAANVAVSPETVTTPAGALTLSVSCDHVHGSVRWYR